MSSWLRSRRFSGRDDRDLRRRAAGPHDGDGGARHGVPHPGARSGPGVSGAVCGGWLHRGGWDDSREAANLARGCDVVTLEIEQISRGEHGGGGELCAGAAGRRDAGGHPGPD